MDGSIRWIKQSNQHQSKCYQVLESHLPPTEFLLANFTIKSSGQPEPTTRCSE